MKNLKGIKRGRLTIIKPTNKRFYGSVIWLCKCDCGKEVEITVNNLQKTLSCGCLHNEINFNNMVGQKFGRLLVIKRVRVNKQGNVLWLCKCDCGKETIKIGSNLIRGTSQSCGCLQVEIFSKMIKSRKGKNHPRFKHGLSKTRKYQKAKGKESKLKKYGITKKDYYKLLDKQGTKCAICKKLSSLNKKELSIDHDHKTGKIRGLLCSSCNIGIGMFKDSIILLQRTIDYLQHTK